MIPKNLTGFYSAAERLSYHPKEIFLLKRIGLKKLIAYDDRFLEVSKILTDLITVSSKKLKVLDIGVGDAVYESMIPANLRKKCQFYGVDISPKQIKRAQKYLFEGRIVDLNIQKLPYPKHFFDLIIISEILEHVFSPNEVLQNADFVLKPGGFILLTYPNSGALQLRLSLLFTGRSVMLNYPQNQQHIRFFSTKDILFMLGKNYKVINSKGLSSFLFDRWNFFAKIPMPRILEIIGNKYLKNLALGSLLLVEKKK